MAVAVALSPLHLVEAVWGVGLRVGDVVRGQGGPDAFVLSVKPAMLGFEGRDFPDPDLQCEQTNLESLVRREAF